MQTLYLVDVRTSNITDELGQTTRVVVQLSDFQGRYIKRFEEGEWAQAYRSLLKGLDEMGLRFVGSLPNLDPHRPDYEMSFWIVTEVTQKRVVPI